MPSHILNDTNRPSLNVYLQSENATMSISDSSKIFQLTSPICVNPDINILVGLTSFEMANTMYNINAGVNDSITISAVSGSSTITLGAKNYSASQMVTALNEAYTTAFYTATGLTSLITSFDRQSNKFTFTGNVNFQITACTFAEEIGLEHQMPTTSGTSYECNDCCLLGGISSLYIRTNNLGVANLDSRGAMDSTISKINVNVSPGEYIFYDEPEHLFFLCNKREISIIEIQITDDRARALVLNGGEFSLCLTFHFTYKRADKRMKEYYLKQELATDSEAEKKKLI